MTRLNYAAVSLSSQFFFLIFHALPHGHCTHPDILSRSSVRFEAFGKYDPRGNDGKGTFGEELLQKEYAVSYHASHLKLRWPYPDHLVQLLTLDLLVSIPALRSTELAAAIAQRPSGRASRLVTGSSAVTIIFSVVVRSKRVGSWRACRRGRRPRRRSRPIHEGELAGRKGRERGKVLFWMLMAVARCSVGGWVRGEIARMKVVRVEDKADPSRMAAVEALTARHGW